MWAAIIIVGSLQVEEEPSLVATSCWRFVRQWRGVDPLCLLFQPLNLIVGINEINLQKAGTLGRDCQKSPLCDDLVSARATNVEPFQATTDDLGVPLVYVLPFGPPYCSAGTGVTAGVFPSNSLYTELETDIIELPEFRR